MTVYKHILFDLDGTLSDPKQGIVNSVQYALSKFDMNEQDDKILTAFIGPPLIDSFHDFYGFSPDKAKLAIQYFREYFKDKGMFENKLFEGVTQMLYTLCKKGYNLYVATSKLESFAVQIIEHFHLQEYFFDVCGCLPDGSRVEKGEIIAYLMGKHQMNPKEWLMIGDRKHDIIGARLNHIDCAAVSFGYGTIEEIKEYAPDYIFESILDLEKFFS
jgi:phosphoglycolate phosphatase